MRALIAALIVCGCASPPASPMPCGASTCDARTHYCEIVNSDVAALPATATCKPLPSSCSADDGCDCFPATTRCRHFCRRIETRGVRGFNLACVGGA